MKRILLSAVLLSSFCFAQKTDSLGLNRTQKTDSVKISIKKEMRTNDIEDVVITGTIKPISRHERKRKSIYSQIKHENTFTSCGNFNYDILLALSVLRIRPEYTNFERQSVRRRK